MKLIQYLTIPKCSPLIVVVGVLVSAGCAARSPRITGAKPQNPPSMEGQLEEIALEGCCDPHVNTNASMVITNYQLKVSVVTPQTSLSQLHMTLQGTREAGSTTANRAEVDFIEDAQEHLARPEWLPGCHGYNIIHLQYHRSDFPLIAEILRCSKEPRCYYSYQDGKIDAGIKDWDSKALAQRR